MGERIDPEKMPDCPACGAAGSLRLETRIEAKEIGTFSVAGSQMKVVASEVIWLVCDSCKIEAKGHR